MRQFGHFYQEIIQISLSFLNHILLIFFHKIFTRNRRDETTWPPLHHRHPQLIELIKPSANVYLSIFILSLNNIDGVFGEGGSLNISADNSEFDSRLFVILNFKGGVGILAILLMIKICLII